MGGASGGPASRYDVRIPLASTMRERGWRAGRGSSVKTPSSASASAMLPRIVSSPARKASTPARAPPTTSTSTGSGARITVSTLRRGRPSRTLTRPTLTATVQHSSSPDSSTIDARARASTSPAPAPTRASSSRRSSAERGSGCFARVILALSARPADRTAATVLPPTDVDSVTSSITLTRQNPRKRRGPGGSRAHFSGFPPYDRHVELT